MRFKCFKSATCNTQAKKWCPDPALNWGPLDPYDNSELGTSFELHFNQILWIIDQRRERLESSVQWLNIFKWLSAERVAKSCTVVDLHNFSSFIQPDTIPAGLAEVYMRAREIDYFILSCNGARVIVYPGKVRHLVIGSTHHTRAVFIDWVEVYPPARYSRPMPKSKTVGDRLYLMDA